MDVTFSIWDKGTLITEYQLELDESKISKTAEDASSVWDEYTVLVEWPKDKTLVIEPYTYSTNLSKQLENG